MTSTPAARPPGSIRRSSHAFPCDPRPCRLDRCRRRAPTAPSRAGAPIFVGPAPARSPSTARTATAPSWPAGSFGRPGASRTPSLTGRPVRHGLPAAGRWHTIRHADTEYRRRSLRAECATEAGASHAGADPADEEIHDAPTPLAPCRDRPPPGPTRRGMSICSRLGGGQRRRSWPTRRSLISGARRPTRGRISRPCTGSSAGTPCSWRGRP